MGLIFLRAAEAALTVGVLGFAGVTLLSLLSDFWWIAELAVNFRVQYLVSGTALVALLCVLRRWRVCLLLVALTGLHGFAVYSAVLPGETIESQSRVSVATFNLAAWSRRGSRLQRFISNQDADIVFLTEVTRRWEQRLPDLDPRYPHVRAMPLPNAFGFALLSKFEVSEYQVHYLNADRLPVLEATIETPTTPLEVIGVHLYSPISKRMVTKRNQQLRELEKLFTPTTNPRLLLGDLNITAYSGYYQRFLEESGLSDSLPSWKLTPTWPSWYPMFRIQIDHCLGSNKLQGLERKAGSRFGSDHLPLFCDYGFVK